jgi:hypothetical protein
VRIRNNPDFPLRGLICSNCGRAFTGGWTRGKLGIKYAYYNCGNKACEKRKAIPKKIYENEFTDFLSKLTPAEIQMEVLKEAIKLAFKQEMGLVVKNNDGIEKNIVQLQKQK